MESQNEDILSDCAERSEDVSHSPTPKPLDEVQIAMQRLAEAKARKATADETRLIVARTALMDRQAAEERALALQREEQRMIQEKWAAKRKAEEDAKQAEQRSAEEAKRQLAAEVERQEAKKREENAKQTEITRLSDEAFRLEQETNQVEAEIARGISLAQPEPTPVTINDARHPLSKIFGVTQVLPEPTPMVTQVEAQLPPELRKDDPSEQRALISTFLQHGVILSALSAKNLLARFAPAEIEQTANYLAQFSSRDTFVGRVENLLWSPLLTGGA